MSPQDDDVQRASARRHPRGVAKIVPPGRPRHITQAAPSDSSASLRRILAGGFVVAALGVGVAVSGPPSDP